ncbi:hypothetical protein BAE44_0011046, partial [Dichanthelium oligosanthes]
PYARALPRTADLSFSFVPSFQGIPVDASDGRVLLQSGLKDGDLVLCDPLSRRYRLLPKIPQDCSPGLRHSLAAFLVPASRKEADETSFRPPEQLVAFLFSSTTGQWIRSAVTDPSVPSFCRMYQPCYAYGCFYWKMISPQEDRLLVFDTRSMEFSTMDIQNHGDGRRDCVIVEAGKGKIGMYSLHSRVDYPYRASYYLRYAIREIGDDNDDDGNRMAARLQDLVLLPSQHHYSFVGATDGCSCSCRAFQGRTRTCVFRMEESNVVDAAYLSVEFETMQIKRVCGSMRHGYAKPYTGFPPSLCLPSVE